ncbi:YtxH domain-containing protein [Occallatibacter savannae]|uniref:YtxH domain-containing protein n=1 Tax=Occallatibacter savannae TaxID=1002691 RepID=UPI000D693F7D|nr:YtxH domain-containing protein [Occallatibacter savannae]
MSEENNGVQGVAWFLAGLGVGALIGILYAPKSGRETREDIAQGAREGSEYLRARGRQAADQVGQYVDKGREQVNQYVGRGREIVDRGRAQWEDFVERGKNIVNDQTSRVGAAVDAGREAFQANSQKSEPTA